jgi:hypothetical protein
VRILRGCQKAAAQLASQRGRGPAVELHAVAACPHDADVCACPHPRPRAPRTKEAGWQGYVVPSEELQALYSVPRAQAMLLLSK